MIAPVRAILRSLDPEMPIVEVRTLREEVEASLWQERLLAWLSTIFGGIARCWQASVSTVRSIMP